jgi:tartrate-resistant acid phosphatase type 5
MRAPSRLATTRAVLLASLASLAACETSSPHHEWRIRLGQAPADLAGAPQGRVLLFSDFGHEATHQQHVVARAILRQNQREPFDMALDVGDNMGPCGPEGHYYLEDNGCAFARDGSTVAPPIPTRNDPGFDGLFENALAHLDVNGQPVPVYVALGNHDVGAGGDCRTTWLPKADEERLKACAEVAHRSRHWVMPGRHYVVEKGPARFIVLDGNVLGDDYGGFTFDDEVEFVRQSSAGCDSRFCFIVSHYSPAAVGKRRLNPAPSYLARMSRLERAMQGKLTGWLGGHYHELHHLRTGSGYDVFVAASTSNSGALEMEGVYPPGAELRFASDAWGFGVLQLAADGWEFKFVNTGNRAVYCCRAVRGAACEEVPCS